MATPLGINPVNSKVYSVVVADDSFTDRQLLKRFLQASQFNVLADVVSGEAVLDFFKYATVIPDILFLDYLMEPGNAIETVKAVRISHPGMMIAVVTGNTNKEIISELVKLKINSYILKPLSKQTLDEKLIQLLGRKDLVLQSKVPTKKNTVKLEDLSIPPLPSVAHKVLMFESNSASGSSELEQIILPDKSICADLLRIANSAYYARSNKVNTIKDAITLLGLKTVKNIVMLQTKKHISRNLTYSEILKKHLLELPILSSLIAFDLSVPLGLKSLREELFLLAMMRKIGMTILALNSPTAYTEILTQRDSAPSDLVKFEKDEFEVSHIDVGLYIFKSWKMPENFMRMMKNQCFKLEDIAQTDNYDKILRLSFILGKNILKIPLLETETSIANAILAHYKAPEETFDLFGEEYYEGIKWHPFFETIH